MGEDARGEREELEAGRGLNVKLPLVEACQVAELYGKHELPPG